MKYFSNKALDKEIQKIAGGEAHVYTADETTLHLNGNEFQISSEYQSKINTAYNRTDWSTYFGIDGQGNIYVKKDANNNPRHFYSYGAVSAGGLSTGGGQPAGNASLSDVTSLTVGQKGTISASGVGSLVVYDKDAIDNMISAAGTVQTVAGVSPVNRDIPIASLTSALGIGSVASGNTNLVTGGTVYTYIANYLTSVWRLVGVTTTALYDGATTNPITINGSSYTASTGDVVLYGTKEFLWGGSAWSELGDAWALWAQNGQLSSLLELKTHTYLGVKNGIYFSGSDIVDASDNPIPDIEIETVNGARRIHFRLPLYSDSWISAGGVSSGGGQSGGNASLSDITTLTYGKKGKISITGTSDYLWVYDMDYIDHAIQSAGTIQSVSLAAGASNGTLHLVVNGTAASDVGVTGLGTAAYEAASAFAAASHNHTVSQITDFPSALPNPYSLTFGNKSYNGSETVSLSASDIGALTSHQTIYKLTMQVGGSQIGTYTPNSAAQTINISKSNITSALGNEYHPYQGSTSLKLIASYFTFDKKLSDGTTESTLTWDDTNKAWKITGNMYATGWISAGGVSTGGGTSGIDLAAMWSSLQNNDIVDTYDTYQFAAAHLPTCGSGLSYTISNGIATGINVSFPVTSVAGKTGAVSLAFSDITGTASTSQIPDLSGAYVTLSTAQNITNWKTYSGEVGNAYKILRKAAGGGGWSYTPLRFTGADDAGFFYIGAFGGGADLYYGYIGCNDYDGLNLRISPSALSWGANAIYHAGNFVAGTNYQAPISAGTGITISGDQVSVTANTFAPYNSNGYLPLNGGTMSNTNVVTNLNADLLDGIHEANFFKAMNFKTEPWRGGIWADYSGSGLYPSGDAGYINIPQWSANSSAAFYTAILRFPLNGTMQVAYVRNTTSTPTWYTFYHSGNSNKSDAAWACSNLEASGVIYASTGIWTDGYVTAGSASSREFKDNVQNMSLEYARNIIMSSRPITFQWNALAHSLCDKYEGDGIGFIAQEAEQLMPFAVSPIFEKYKRLDYTAYISPLVAVAQSHETRIQQLENRVKELEDENGKLKARLTN